MLEISDKIVFISKWQKNNFKDLSKTTLTKLKLFIIVFQTKKFFKKEKFITFVGKLNYSKVMIFRDALTKILNEYKDWKISLVMKQERPIFNHPRHFELGFLNHKKVLHFLNNQKLL